jgi:N-acetylmannosamine-6-phosphate 2-epimerase/N-acetylmannosamine kinase
LINDGCWTALNPKTLPIEPGFPLTAELQSRFAVPVTSVNDAQAAAWGEYRHGAGQGEDLVFLTISTGIGGGAVLNGRLVTGKHGLAGSVGQTRFGPLPCAERVEDQTSGLWIASAAKEAGHDLDARGVMAASHAGEAWAEAIVERAVEHIAMLIHNLHMLYDPAVFVIGGGIGLADGMLERFEHRLTALPPDLRPTLSHAALGKNAGVIGAADLAMAEFNQQGGK